MIDNLGAVNVERFISLMSREPFDYTRWRQDNLEDEDVRTLSRKAMQYRRDSRHWGSPPELVEIEVT